MSILQTPEMSFFIYIAVFVGILLAFEGVRQIASREESSSQAMNRRMRIIKNGASSDDIKKMLLNAKTNTQDRSISARFSRTLSQAGLHIGFYKFVLGTLALFFLMFLLLSQVFPSMTALIISFTLGFVAPYLFVFALRAQRMEKLTKQLPEALDLMARGLEVGHPLSVTVGNVASDMPDPVGSEFGLIQDQVNYGDEITDAFSDFADRTDLEDARYTAVSVGIQHGTGGNLGHVLRVLSKVIRDRAMMRKKIRAISAEGRLSAFILSILPFVIMLVVHVTAPTFYGEVKDDPMFIYFAAGVLVLIAMQALILSRMVNFKF